MTIEVLSADEQGDENLQRWAAAGLPVPPSWRIHRDTVLELDGDALIKQLRSLPRMFNGERYWVLHQGAMNEHSQRESLLNLDSDDALAAALASVFRRPGAPDQVIVQALPRQRAAGILFTRHPLRQDLPHMVVEGVVDGGAERQRLIFDVDGQLVYRGKGGTVELDQLVGGAALLALADQLRRQFQRPQAGEWVYDGEQLWLLQTLPVGSLPVPKEAWTRRATATLFNQALTPLWYTLEGRWLKTAFWWRLVDQRGWTDLAKVEPYRRQQSHLYANSEFFRRLQAGHPGAKARVPPAWQPLEPKEGAPAPESAQRSWRRALTLAVLARRLRRWRAPHDDRERLWRALMALDRLGERLAREEGELLYLALPDHLVGRREPLPLEQLLSGEERRVLDAVIRDDQAALDRAGLRPGADPVHSALRDGPPQRANLGPPTRAPGASPPSNGDDKQDNSPASVVRLAATARSLRFALANRLRDVLRRMGALLTQERLLAHPDDVFFLYFDELWELWIGRALPASAAGEVIGQRKVRYLEDAHAGAPDWKMDRIGFGFGGGGRFSPVLAGSTLVEGQARGALRRVCSAWNLNRVQRGEILVVDQVDPSWVPWLVQASGLVIADRDPLNAAAALAREYGIPAIWGVSDVMHSVADGQSAELDAQAGTLNVSMPDEDS